MRKFSVVVSLFFLGFIFSALINILISPFAEIPLAVQYLIYPLIHVSIVSVGYRMILRQPLVKQYLLLTAILLYLGFLVLYFVLDVFSPLGFYLEFIHRYRG